jgi:thymidylate kinase
MSDDQSHYEIHPQIEEVFRSLDKAGVQWLLFRGEERMVRPTGDIDLLIAPQDLEATDDVLVTLGFSRQGSALLVTRRAYVAYVAEDDLWLRFDLVTRVAFGELLELDTSAAEAFLRAKCRIGALFLPAPNDAFWHLLLHYMLDRGDVPLPWREILHDRAKEADAVGPLGAFIDAIPGDATSQRVLIAVQDADWSSLQDLFRDIRASWPLAQSPTTRVRFSAQRALSRIGVSQWSSFRPGLSVAVLGPDGAGKTTLALGLRDSLAIPTRYVYMGMWKEGRLEQLLSHVRGLNFLLMLIRLVARTIRLHYYRWRGCIVVLDRFNYDAVLVTKESTWRQRATAALVLRMSQSPDLIVVLDLPGEEAFARKGEEDAATLNEWRAAYRSLESGSAPLVVLDATKPIAEVHRLATEAIWATIRRRSDLKRA